MLTIKQALPIAAVSRRPGLLDTPLSWLPSRPLSTSIIYPGILFHAILSLSQTSS